MQKFSRQSIGDLRELIRKDLLSVGGRPSLMGFFRKVFVDPGFSAVFRYRLCVYFFRRAGLGRILSKFIWRGLVRNNASYFSPRSEILGGLRLPHAVGIVVGDGVVIGEDVTVFQNVTIGTAGGADIMYPSIGDGVVIYAGACIIGAVSVGAKSTVGANAVVNRDVPSNVTVVGVPARVLGAAK